MYKNFRNERDSNKGLRRKEKKRKRKPEKQKGFSATQSGQQLLTWKDEDEVAEPNPLTWKDVSRWAGINTPQSLGRCRLHQLQQSPQVSPSLGAMRSLPSPLPARTPHQLNSRIINE